MDYQTFKNSCIAAIKGKDIYFQGPEGAIFNRELFKPTEHGFDTWTVFNSQGYYLEIFYRPQGYRFIFRFNTPIGKFQIEITMDDVKEQTLQFILLHIFESINHEHSEAD